MSTTEPRFRVHRIGPEIGVAAPTKQLESWLNSLPADWRPVLLTVDAKGGLIVIAERRRDGE